MILGTCSICGGPVSFPEYCYSTRRPVPQCEWCGATKERPFGPVIPMTPKRKYIEVDWKQYEKKVWSLPRWTCET